MTEERERWRREGEEALTSLQQNGMPDLILMDEQMYVHEGRGEERGEVGERGGGDEREPEREEGFLILSLRPILDGVQTTKIIREKYPSTWVYIVSMTANAFPGNDRGVEED